MKRMEWSHGSESDSLAALYAIMRYRSLKFDNVRAAREYCRNNFMHYNTLQELEDLRKELLKRLDTMNVHIPPRPDEVSGEAKVMLQVAIFGAFYPNYFVGEFSDKRELQNVTPNSWCGEIIDPTRSILLSGLPQEASEDQIKVL